MALDSCWKPLTPESLALAEKAERDVRLAMEDNLRCECGERVKACHKPSPDGRLYPTHHYPHKESRRLAPVKRGGPRKSF
jgi:hypothetical protein